MVTISSELEDFEWVMTPSRFLAIVANQHAGELQRALDYLATLTPHLLESFALRQNMRPILTDEEDEQLKAILEEALKFNN